MSDPRRPLLNLNLRLFAWPVLALLLWAGPVFRGLFFEPDLLPAQILIAAAFVLVAWQEVLERRPLLGRHPLDWAFLALALSYGLSYLVAADRRAAYGEALKYGAYFMAYYCASRLVAAPGLGGNAGRGRAGGAARWSPARAAAVLAYAMVVSATMVAALGVLSAAGVVDFPGALASGRILSTLQYHNALGGYLVLADLLLLALLSAGGQAAWQAAGGAALFLCLAALLGTLSRGAWLAGLAGLALLLAALPPAQRWRALYAQGLALVLAGIAMRSVLPGAGTPGWHGVKALVAGLVLSAALVPLYEWGARLLAARPLRPQTRRLAVWLAIAYVGAVAAFYFAYTATALPTPASQILPESVVYRAEAIDPGQASVVGRKEYMRDALRIWRDHPLLGTGGGGWNALYHLYQRSLYWTTEVHSAPLQVAVEAGAVGAAAFLAAWGFFLRGAWRLLRREMEAVSAAVALPAGLGVAALALGLHSVGDFDLSLPAIALTLWTVFGSVAGLEMAGMARTGHREAGTRAMAGAAWAVAAALAALSLALPSVHLYQAGQAGAEGARLMAEGELQSAAEKLATAAALDPRRASYRLDLGQILSVAGVAQGRGDLLERGEKEVRQALALQPHDIRVAMRAAEVFALQGKPDLVAEQAERLAEMLPLATFPYERLAVAYVAAAQAQLRYGERDRAEAYIGKALELPARVEGRRGGNGWRARGALPQVTPLIRLAAAQALYLKGEDGRAAEALEPLTRDRQVGAVARLWLAAVRWRAGERVDVAPELRPALDELLEAPRLSGGG